MTAPTGPPSGWYPDPHGPPGQQRWWDSSAQAWGDYTQREGEGAVLRPIVAPPAPAAAASPAGTGVADKRRTSTRTWIVLAVALGIGALWLNGSLDEPLSQVGLNTETCAENLFGNRMCGDELVSFCKTHYDPDVNEETCGPVLRDEGIDPAAIAAAQKRKEDAEAEQSDAEFDDGIARGDVDDAIAVVEQCFDTKADYTRCETDEDFDYAATVSIGPAAGEVEIRASSPTSYTVIGHSESGTDFTYVKDEGEEWSCDRPGKGDCHADSTWTPRGS